MTGQPVEREWGPAPTLERAAWAVLSPGLGGQGSPLDPATVTWTADSASEIVARVRDHADSSRDSFLQKLTRQLEGASRASILLTAELLYLQSLPLVNVGAHAKRARVAAVLALLPDSPAVPEVMATGWNDIGIFSGGTSFNTRVAFHLIWLAEFVQRWAQAPELVKADALADPAAFGRFVAAEPSNELAIRQSLCYLTFPTYFEPIVKADHRRRIRDTFCALIGGPSGADDPAINSDLWAIRSAAENKAGSPVEWYEEPWVSQWWPRKPGASDQRAWLVRTKSAETLAAWLSEGFVSLPATHLGEVEPGSDRKAVRAAVELGYEHLDYSQQLALTTDYFNFLTRMSPDDVVLTRNDDRIHIGRITEDPYYWEVEGDRLRRPTAWELTRLDPDELPSPLPALLQSQGVVVDLTDGLEAIRQLVADMATSPDLGPVPIPKPWSIDVTVTLPHVTEALAARLCSDPKPLQEMVDVLQSRWQIVLYGPPGTGKTIIALELARHIVGTDHSEHHQLVQFHPSYSYEDFFEGYRPTQTESGQATFSIQAGPLRRIASDAKANPGLPFVLIIDELNRANLAKVFGELYFLLEYRDRTIRLQYRPEEAFQLPPNLFIIATMNTADRSIALLDAAMRRRFAFFELHPDDPPVRDVLANFLAASQKDGDPRAQLLAHLNAAIGDTDRDFKIGPSYLMRPEADSEVGLERIWRHDILPLLEEHYYGRMERKDVHSRFGLAALRQAGYPAAATAPDDAAPAPEVGKPTADGTPGEGS